MYSIENRRKSIMSGISKKFLGAFVGLLALGPSPTHDLA
jgi:hypothetical protein